MSEIDKNLSEILETEYEEVVEENEEPSTEIIPAPERLPAPVNRDADFDYELSRINHRDLLDKGNEALDELLKIAKEQQHPRAYEVAAGMLKNLSDMTDKLMVLHEKKKALEAKGVTTPNVVNVDKAVFVGSTADLLKKIKKD